MKFYTDQKVFLKDNRYSEYPYLLIHYINFYDNGQDFGWEVVLKTPQGVVIDMVDIDAITPITVNEPAELLKELL